MNTLSFSFGAMDFGIMFGMRYHFQPLAEGQDKSCFSDSACMHQLLTPSVLVESFERLIFYFFYPFGRRPVRLYTIWWWKAYFCKVIVK